LARDKPDASAGLADEAAAKVREQMRPKYEALPGLPEDERAWREVEVWEEEDALLAGAVDRLIPAGRGNTLLAGAQPVRLT
jgi:hypothetical protein